MSQRDKVLQIWEPELPLVMAGGLKQGRMHIEDVAL
jgi:hypothetical protein